MAVRPEPLVVAVVTVFADQFGGGPAAKVQGMTCPQLFEFLAEARVARRDLLLDDPQQKRVAGLTGSVGGSINLIQKIVREIDLGLGHLASIGRGFD
jgi:hypothetical protein